MAPILVWRVVFGVQIQGRLETDNIAGWGKYFGWHQFEYLLGGTNFVGWHQFKAPQFKAPSWGLETENFMGGTNLGGLALLGR